MHARFHVTVYASYACAVNSSSWKTSSEVPRNVSKKATFFEPDFFNIRLSTSPSVELCGTSELRLGSQGGCTT